MLNVENFTDVILKILLLVPMAVIFFAPSIAFGNMVFGILACAVYLYEVARL